MSEALTADDLTRADEYTLDEAVDFMVNSADSARVMTHADVWAVVHVDTDEFGDVLSTAVDTSDVVVHNADRSKGAVSIALEKFADEL